MKPTIHQPENAADMPRGTVLGTGLLALDIVMSNVSGEPQKQWVGGTCGNVLVALAYLGWEAQPVARLKSGLAADRILSDLTEWGVSNRFVSVTHDGSTPVIFEKITQGAGNVPRHSFSWRCPDCGIQFPGFKSVLTSVAERVAQQVGPLQVFFFDRATPASILLAKSCAERGRSSSSSRPASATRSISDRLGKSPTSSNTPTNGYANCRRSGWRVARSCRSRRSARQGSATAKF